MGVRFACHHCGKHLNIKFELAGKRGICPSCNGKFRIPLKDAEISQPLNTQAETADSKTRNESQTQAHNDDESHQGSEPVAEVTPVSESVVPVSASATKIGNQVLAPTPKNITEALASFDASSSWYIRPPSGGQYGPANTEILAQWIEEGRVAASSLIWRDGWPQWRTATEAFPDLSKQLPGSTEDQQNNTSSLALSEHVHLEQNSSSQANRPLSGTQHLGQQKRDRSFRRATFIIALAVIAIGLIGTLIFVTNRELFGS